jgi:hypothetical protein
LAQAGVQLVSTAEKTGIQALERLYGGSKPMQAGRIEKREFDYKRHGTLCLLANWLVAEGKMIAPLFHPPARKLTMPTILNKPLLVLLIWDGFLFMTNSIPITQKAWYA